MNSAKQVLFLLMAIFSSNLAEEERIIVPRTDAVSPRGRVRDINFRNAMLAEVTAISGYLNSENGRNDNPQSYVFDYTATDKEGNVHFRKEQADANGEVSGSYGYSDIKGLYRTVYYVADSSGFHASIMTNEPGIDAKESPADVNLMASEPPVDIQKNNNEFRGTRNGDIINYGIRARTRGNAFNTIENPMLWTTISRNQYPDVAHHLTATIEKLFKSEINSIESGEDNDEEHEEKDLEKKGI